MSNDTFEPLVDAAIRRTRTAVTTRTAGGRWRHCIVTAAAWTVMAAIIAAGWTIATTPPVVEVVDARLAERLANDERIWPVASARAVAARATVDALTYDPATNAVDGQARPVPGQDRVRQTVETVTPGTVEARGDQAVVAVSALVVTEATPPATDLDVAPAVDVRRRWRQVEVPVARTGGGTVTLAGQPVEVAAPAVAVPDPPNLPNVHRDLTDETDEFAEAVFAAWAGDSRAALDAVTDGSIPLLAEGVELERLAGWEVAPAVDRGRNQARPTELVGQAEVTWRHDGTVESTQTYRVGLVQDSGGRWQATGIGPAHPNQ